MQRNLRRTITILLHLIFWVAAWYALQAVVGTVAVENVTIINGKKTTTQVLENQDRSVTIIWLLSACLFYINVLLLLPWFIRARKTLYYILSLASFFLAVIVIDYFIRQVPSERVEQHFIPKFFSPRIFIYGLFLGFSFAYFFIREWIRNEQVKRELREHQLRTELNFLRSQIEPHFLFNSLNNLFYMAQETGHRELIKGISSLSSMMRYMLYESNIERVPLKDEVSYLDHYIQLQSLKFEQHDKIDFSFEKTGDIESFTIAPLLLLPFVENAFKYGISYEAKSFIFIKLSVDKHQLSFSVRNTNHSHIHQNNTSKTGIGLENVKRRLQLIYPLHHQLAINPGNDVFEIQLYITLQL